MRQEDGEAANPAAAAAAIYCCCCYSCSVHCDTLINQPGTGRLLQPTRVMPTAYLCTNLKTDAGATRASRPWQARSLVR